VEKDCRVNGETDRGCGNKENGQSYLSASGSPSRHPAREVWVERMIPVVCPGICKARPPLKVSLQIKVCCSGTNISFKMLASILA
jgi:hypothetical protein